MIARGLAALALLGATALAAPRTHAWCRTTTSPAQPDPTVCPARGAPVAWPSACVGLHLDPRVIPADLSVSKVRTALTASAAAWAAATCDPARRTHPGFVMTVLHELALPVGYTDDGPNANVVVFRDRWGDDPFHPPDAAAVTIVTFGARTATILDTDTELNLRGPENPRGMVFTTAIGDASGADLRTILTHELGHSHGLAHSAERSAVMWYSAGRGEQRRTPTDDDAAGLCAIYPPRAAGRCDPEAGYRAFQGGGLACASGPARGRGGSWASLGGVALLVAAAALSARR